MNLIGNILWIFLGGGLILFIEYIIGGIFLCLTIIGIPFGIQKFKLAVLSLRPFGLNVVETDRASGCLAIILNIVWILTGGIWIALTHVVLAIIFTILIIGIPFARQHMKLASLALTPFGKNLE
ncbi:MAG: YccF domain-containing protein [Bacteroidales bacterium]|nr:YccF domain-containing protein [Bacteroidales bacterium]